MTNLAIKHKTINLGQQFSDEEGIVYRFMSIWYLKAPSMLACAAYLACKSEAYE